MRKGRAVPGANLIREMTDQMRHRGPDDSGYHSEGPIALGHRRLSIIDVATGQQPMFNEDKSMAIVFNGEIYNFEDLQKDLKGRGHRFHTHSDTETILHAFEEWGEESPRRLRGMFAYAIWDRVRKKLFLARDRIGKKPLYYLETPDCFLFASEVKAILQHSLVKREIDLEAVTDYLTYKYVPAPKCIFKGMRKLLPAHSLTVSPEYCTEKEYWNLRFQSDGSRSEESWAEELVHQIRESVKIRLKSEVPLGAFLSGGLDSSVIVGNMAGLMDRPVETMSIGFREEKYNELPFARVVATRFGTSHHEFIVDTDAASMVERLACVYDEPFADSSSIPTYHVSRIARQKVTVVLSGDGGDENFAGYRRYFYDLLENRVRRIIPGAAGRTLFGMIGRIYPKGDWLPQPLRAKTLLTNLSRSSEEGYFRSLSTFQPEMKQLIFRPEVRERLGGYDSFSVLEDHFRKAETDDPLSRIQYVDIKTYLTDDILVKVDRASMANSLEVRAPLLDHRLMEFAANIPSTMKLRGMSGKHILKLASKNLLPDQLVYRKKMGFSIPLDEWLRKELKGVAADLLLDTNSRVSRFFDASVIQKMWMDHQAKWKNYGMHLWSLLTFETWHRKYIG